MRVVIMAILIFSLSAQSGDPRSWLEIKKEAENQLINEDRAEAIILIKKFLQQKNGKVQNQQAIEFLKNITQLFFTENTHKTYFLGKSLFVSEPERAKEKFLLAKTKEPLNEKISLDLARLFMSQGDCKSAGKEALFSYEQNPYSEAASLILLQANHCLGNWETFDEQLKKIIKDGRISKEDSLILEILKLKNDYTREEAASKIEKLYTKDSEFPLAIYWKQKSSQMPSKSKKQLVEKYLSVCQNEKAKVLERYENYPGLCNYISEMESVLQ